MKKFSFSQCYPSLQRIDAHAVHKSFLIPRTQYQKGCAKLYKSYLHGYFCYCHLIRNIAFLLLLPD